ncbi:hypothetical protein [Spirillospora sp. NPDC047279]|uniref:hypothetical protein n=1 Tax=Spirillospora sp. NPDC047279 TaxID=3155478 RepID=UPI0033D61C2E
MLFPKHTWAGLADGTITLAFRRWARPRVRAGTRLRTAAGVVAVEDVRTVDAASITEDEARRAGHASLEELLAFLAARSDGEVHRVLLRFEGADPREALRERADPDAGELAAVLARLERFDRASRRGPWTAAVLRLIADNPGVRAPDLAGRRGVETAPFKADVRKLKELGLTESLPVGYEISPRGRTVLAALESGA